MSEILSEMPYNHEGHMERPNFGVTYTSNTSLNRLYNPMIAQLKTPIGLVRFYLQESAKVIGVIDAVKPGGESSNQIIFALRFKSNHTLVSIPKEFKKKILQVDNVAIDKVFEGMGIASFVYATLAKSGITILSDTSQFDDGKMLWKKMARQANAMDYRIMVLDDEYGFINDSNGCPLEYNSTNIDDSSIWSSGADVRGEHILLCMNHF